MPNDLITKASKLRFITAASLFDGHDVSINIMRRMLQERGVEVIHLGHNRSALEVATAAIQEDVDAVALSSYQGGHMEFFQYVRELLDAQGGEEIKIFGGGGGVITSEEIKSLHSKGITRIYSPEDGQRMGLTGIIAHMIEQCPKRNLETFNLKWPLVRQLGRVISYIEEKGKIPSYLAEGQRKKKQPPLILGITGTGGAGKSSLIDELLTRFQFFYPNFSIGLLSIDPSRKKGEGGALLGDRIRLTTEITENLYVRSLATRSSRSELAPTTTLISSYLKTWNFDLLIIETSGIGQSSFEITELADLSLYVMTPEYGAATQLEKIEMLESADFIAINKFDRKNAEDAFRDVKKQYCRNKHFFSPEQQQDVPIFGVMASRFNDLGVNGLWLALIKKFNEYWKEEVLSPPSLNWNYSSIQSHQLIPPERTNYLREISKVCRQYTQTTEEKVKKIYAYESTQEVLRQFPEIQELKEREQELAKELQEEKELLKNFFKLQKSYESGCYTYIVRGKEVSVKTKNQTLSLLSIPKVATPHFISLADTYRFLRRSHLPGNFPFRGGVFPFKREDEDPKRMFAGEGGPERTNSRFHYLCKGDSFKRLSTAFDSVTLYGEDPDYRPDIFGKIGEAGVSIAHLEDMKALFKGIDLIDPKTSVSMTINGPAPIILAMFLKTAVAQNPEKNPLEIYKSIRGTVQADILKEDQAQNTCIFNLDFSLKLMGDVQEYFCKHQLKNYYTVSVSGYHIAEAGANPITQVAFTLANGFTYIEYYLSRGLPIDDFCPNLSYFFSNGLDPEYAVIGSVARKIWAITLKEKYGANTTSQRFKYHIQTSGRSLHAQEIDFNDIRTTLQAIFALNDNCNSLHTNAYDEAITTPTEESVRRAMAIQLIVNKEFGMNKTDNSFQGSFWFEELCDLVEEAILQEFERLSDRGGVLAAMENMYQRGKIQEESLFYETLKDQGKLPIIGVNTFLPSQGHSSIPSVPISRCTEEEKISRIKQLEQFKLRHKDKSQNALEKLKQVALSGENVFEELLETIETCSLGQITNALYQVGGKYRRNI